MTDLGPDGRCDMDPHELMEAMERRRVGAAA